MRRRIEQHRRERGGGFVTIEEPTDLAGALRRVPPDCGVALVDCLTVWLGNLMHERGVDCPYPEVDAFMASLGDLPFDLILVTNEIGSGIVPTNEMAREFRDRAGRLNQQIARRADRVILLVSGIPLTIKGANPG
jgi:adenosylcobinamide kinase/adenosylcobinamide-phosphate guanylyltransferase